MVRSHLNYVVGDLGVNPRRLKQYINSYVLQVSVKPTLNAAAVLAIQTITYRDDWKVVRNALYADRDLLLNALVQPNMEMIKDSLANLDPEYLRIPDSFFEYIAAATPMSPDGPGRPLLNVGPNIQEYLYSGEATLSTVNTSFVSIIPIVGKLRSVLRAAIADDGTLLQPQGLQEFQKQVDLAISSVASVPGVIGQLVSGSLQSMLQSASLLASSPTATNDERKTFRALTEERIASARQNLLRAYDASRVPALRPDIPPPSPSVQRGPEQESGFEKRAEAAC